MTPLELAQWAIMPIYFIAGVFAIHNIITVIYNCVTMKCFHIAINSYIALMCIMYIGLQIDWIFVGHGNEIPSIIDLAWLLHEYMVGILLLILTSVAPIFIKTDNSLDE